MAKQSRKGEQDSRIPQSDPQVTELSEGVTPGIQWLLGHWERCWEPFRNKYTDWWERVGQCGPVYHLPQTIVDELASPRGLDKRTGQRFSPLISHLDAQAERAFAEVCRSRTNTTIGVWGAMPIDYPLDYSTQRLSMNETAVIQLENDYKNLNWDEHYTSKERATNSLVRDLNDPLLQAGQRSLIGYAAQLVFNPQFRRELSELKRLWSAHEIRPVFPLKPGSLSLPLGRTGSSSTEPAMLSESHALFLRDLSQFTSKWNLIQLTSWDLPLPQGTLEDLPLGLLARLVGPDKRATFVPSHFDYPSNVNIGKRLRRAQRNAAQDAGIDQRHPVAGASGRGNSASQYENAFRLWLIERSFSARYGKPKGFVARITDAFCWHLDCSENWIKQLRKLYSPYLDGP